MGKRTGGIVEQKTKEIQQQKTRPKEEVKQKTKPKDKQNLNKIM